MTSKESGPGIAGAGGRAALVALFVSAAVALVGPAVSDGIDRALDADEGNRLVAYRDSVGIWTGCRGVIRDRGRRIAPRQRFTIEQCRELNDVEKVRHLRAVLEAVPTLQRGCPEACARPNTIIAATRLAYNIGGDGFRRSSIARLMNAGDWAGACAAFVRFNRAGGRILRGLVLRRDRERRQCLLDVTQPGD